MRVVGSAFLAAALALAADPKLTSSDRVEIIRGLMSEYATAKALLPRSKKPLPFDSSGHYDVKHWEAVARETGPAARAGDMIQITKVSIEDDKILLEINGGVRSGRRWTDRIEVGMGSRTTPIGASGTPTAGTNIAIEFHKPVPPLKAAEIKKMLALIMDFEKRSATEIYAEQLPPEVQQAIKEKRAREGMDKEQVLLALGRPRTKTRETKDGVELEDWIFGEAPGKITFVTFNGNKVVRVKESYAGLGLEAAPKLDPK
jgi:hypothetical protein